MDAEALWLIAAILLQGALALGLAWYLGTIRIPLITGGKVRIKDIALSNAAWPDREKQVSNALDNQFQLPVLFFVGAILALNFGPILLETALAWVFVLSRIAHSYIHITDNHVIRRFWAYIVGLGVLTLFWLVLIGRVVVVAMLFGRA